MNHCVSMKTFEGQKFQSFMDFDLTLKILSISEIAYSYRAKFIHEELERGNY